MPCPLSRRCSMSCSTMCSRIMYLCIVMNTRENKRGVCRAIFAQARDFSEPRWFDMHSQSASFVDLGVMMNGLSLAGGEATWVD